MYLKSLAEKDQSAFAKELQSEFPKLFDMATMKWKISTPQDATSYWLDAIDARQVPASVRDLSIENIGRQTKVLNDDKINCIFMPKIENKLIDDYVVEEGLDFDSNIVTGVKENPAYDLVRSALNEHLNFNNVINITALPVYHLDVNQLIAVENNESDIHGEYLIESISLPLTLDGMMTINARKAISRI